MLFVLCVIDVYMKYALVITLKDKKDEKIAKTFQKILHKSYRKPKKTWIDKIIRKVYHVMNTYVKRYGN